MAARVLLREITSEEGNRLLRIVRRTSGSVVTWRRAQIVLLSAQGMSPPAISEGGCPGSRRTLSGGPPVPSVAVGSVLGE